MNEVIALLRNTDYLLPTVVPDNVTKAHLI